MIFLVCTLNTNNPSTLTLFHLMLIPHVNQKSVLSSEQFITSRTSDLHCSVLFKMPIEQLFCFIDQVACVTDKAFVNIICIIFSSDFFKL